MMEKTQQGMTLVELMIAGVIGLIALASILTVYASTVRHMRQQLETTQLHQQVHGMLHLISRDIRRHGYWAFDPLLQAVDNNPFQRTPNQLRIGAYPAETGDSCLLLAYDLDHDGLVGVGKCRRGRCPVDSDDDNVEQFGYRLRNGRLQSRYGGEQYSCDSGFWQALNDASVEITHLKFTQSTHCNNLTAPLQACDNSSARLHQQAVMIDITAQTANKPGSGIAFSQWVRIRNDRLETNKP